MRVDPDDGAVLRVQFFHLEEVFSSEDDVVVEFIPGLCFVEQVVYIYIFIKKLQGGEGIELDQRFLGAYSPFLKFWKSAMYGFTYQYVKAASFGPGNLEIGLK